MGVSGELHSHDVHPVGHVPLAFGMKHPSVVPIGPGTLQQSSPGAQQLLPQHVPPGPQRGPLHGGVVQTPLSQYPVVASHLFPHAPQLLMSLFRLVHAASQQVKSQNPQAPPLELLALLEPPIPPVPMAPALPPTPMAPPLPPVPVEADAELAPPEPPLSISAPQPATRSPIKLKKRTLCCMAPMLPRHRRQYTSRRNAPRASASDGDRFGRRVGDGQRASSRTTVCPSCRSSGRFVAVMYRADSSGCAKC
jgi:hypothetical protein